MMWIEEKFQQVNNESSNFWTKNQRQQKEGLHLMWMSVYWLIPVRVYACQCHFSWGIDRLVSSHDHHVLPSWFWFCFCSFSEGECKFHVLYSCQSLFVLFSHVLRNGLHLGSTSFFCFQLWIQLAGLAIRYYPGRMMLWTDKQLSICITKSCFNLNYDLEQNNFCVYLYIYRAVLHYHDKSFNW